MTCPHDCKESDRGRCVIGACPNPGCWEFPAITPERFLCWSCGKALFTFCAKDAETDIARPQGVA